MIEALKIILFIGVVCQTGAKTLYFSPKSSMNKHQKNVHDSDAFTIQITQDCQYSVLIDNKTWLQSAPTWFHVGGKNYSTETGNLKLLGIYQAGGVDNVGLWDTINCQFSADNTSIIAFFKKYQDHDAWTFGQYFLTGAEGTSIGEKDGLISGFPNFKVDGSIADLGFLTYGYIMVGNMGKTLGRWNAKSFNMANGRNSGPMALFDRGDNCLFMSPYNQFMTASAVYTKETANYQWGIMGSVESIPKGFIYETIMYFNPAGINKAISGWGNLMRLQYNKQQNYRKSDFTNNYLSYWTDNGAYYVQYYAKDSLIANLTYEEAMLGVKKYADQENIPYRSLQYSVWFKPGDRGGIDLWEANPKLFPSGMRYMFNKTGLPATAHNRWWDSNTKYAKANGGKYNFIIEEKYAIPMDEQFWTDLFSLSQQYGFVTYMQDWLNWQFNEMEATTNNTWLARAWLMQMGDGARKNGITVQYCMSESRHILQSLEIPVVTQARASNDYQPGDDKQWRIGISSMFADAVGVTPFKDTFWTTTDQPGNYYKGTEPYPTLEAVVATLSTGPVGPGDMIGGTNRSLLMKCCAEDGLILKPSKPATAINFQMKETAFGEKSVPDAEIWSTYTLVGSYFFGIIFAADVKSSVAVGPYEAGFSEKLPKSYVFEHNDLPTGSLAEFTDEKPVLVTRTCTKTNVCIFYTTPVFYFKEKELVLLGERNKWVPMSPQRVTAIRFDDFDVNVFLKGAAKEVVEFSFVYGSKPGKFMCEMSEAGTAKISIVDMNCLGF